MTSTKLTTAQIGKCGELLIQFQLLLNGIESAPLTTDAGVDLVAYSPWQERPLSIQVKTNLRAKPGGGKGKEALDWWIPQDCPAQLVALVDLSSQSAWIFSKGEIEELSQQHSNGRFHLYIYTDPTAKPRNGGRLSHLHEFAPYQLSARIHELFGGRSNQSFNPDVASVSHFPHDRFGILASSRRAASATPVNSPR